MLVFYKFSILYRINQGLTKLYLSNIFITIDDFQSLEYVK